MKESDVIICGHGSGKPSLKSLSDYCTLRYNQIAKNGKRKGIIKVMRLKTLTDDKRKEFHDTYKTILGRNDYNQGLRQFVYTQYKGKYYSDCSSSGMATFNKIGYKVGLLNTAGIYQSKLFEEVPIKIVNGHITNLEVLKVGDCLLYVGSDASRPLQIGHVEYVYEIKVATTNPTTNKPTKPTQTTNKTNSISKTQTKSMKTSQNGIDFITREEGCKLTAYQLKGEKFCTIGIGHYCSNNEYKLGDKITMAKAKELLSQDLKRFELAVNKYCSKFTLTQNMFDALVSYTYNRGEGGLKELVTNSKDLSTMADNMVKYWGKAERYKTALIARRKREKDLFLTGYKSNKPKSTTNNNTTKEYKIKVNTDILNVRKQSSSNSDKVTSIKRNQVYTITEEKNGWGKLKSGIGWICLKYTIKL